MQVHEIRAIKKPQILEPSSITSLSFLQLIPFDIEAKILKESFVKSSDKTAGSTKRIIIMIAITPQAFFM